MDIDQFLHNHLRLGHLYNRFYHFTDQKNLESIRKTGLVCTGQLESSRMLPNVVTGGDEVSLASDARSGTNKYVCLCFTTQHPMSYIAQTQRNLNPKYLHISPKVIKLPGVMIALAPSNQTGVTPKVASDALDEMDLEVLYRRTDWNSPQVMDRLKAARKYELLIPSSVPIEYIVHGL